jgi:hypothetical protein
MSSHIDVKPAVAEIRRALKARSLKPFQWSVTYGRGSDYGWITITAAPKRLVNGSLTAEDRMVLSGLLGESVHHQGAMVAASSDYRQEYIDRANGRKPSVTTGGDK